MPLVADECPDKAQLLEYVLPICSSGIMNYERQSGHDLNDYEGCM